MSEFQAGTAVFIYTSLGPHICNWVDSLCDVCPIVVIEVFRRQPIYPWQSEYVPRRAVHIRLSGAEYNEDDSRALVARLQSHLAAIKPAVVFTGRYDLKIMRSAAWWARRHRVVSVLVADSWMGDKVRPRLKEFMKRLFFRLMYDAVFVAGTLSKQYYRGLGFPSTRIWEGVDVVDNAHFLSVSLNAVETGQRWVSGVELPSRFILCVARHAPEKNLPMLISAFAKYRSAGGQLSLVLSGTGPDTGALEKLVEAAQVTMATTFLGWVAYEEMPLLYAHCTLLVLASVSEPWGLVVNEALACGRPVAVSSKCGSHADLVRDGVNGFLFDPSDLDRLAAIFQTSEEDPNLLKEMGDQGRLIVNRFSLESRALTSANMLQTLGTTEA